LAPWLTTKFCTSAVVGLRLTTTDFSVTGVLAAFCSQTASKLEEENDNRCLRAVGQPGEGETSCSTIVVPSDRCSWRDDNYGSAFIGTEDAISTNRVKM